MVFVAQQYHLYMEGRRFRRVDILAKDEGGEDVLIEIKKDKAKDFTLTQQVNEYIQLYKQQTGRKCSAIIVAREFSEKLQKEAAKRDDIRLWVVSGIPTTTKDALKLSKAKSSEVKDKYMSIFDSCRITFKGTVRGLNTEFENFCKKHLDWKEVIPLLLPAVEGQIAWREKQTGFVPAWKIFQTWINNRCWEDELPSGTTNPSAPARPTCLVCKSVSGIVSDLNRKKGEKVYLCGPCRDAFKRMKGERGWGWFSKAEIERIVGQGKKNPPEKPAKEPDLVQQDKIQKTVQKLAKDMTR